MRKFKQIDYEKEDFGRALDKVMAYHVKDLFRMALKKFQDKRKIWEHYLAFVKLKFPNSVSAIYQELLRYHHETDDYIEAASHEMSRDNYTVASSILLQGMGLHKESSKELVVMYIECSMQQGELHEESARTATLLQASKFYEMFLKNSNEVGIVCDLLRRIEGFSYTMNFQNTILSDLIAHSAGEAEVWELIASRHLRGLVYKLPNQVVDESSPEEVPTIPFDVRLRYTIAIYEKSLSAVCGANKNEMFGFFIKKLLEIDETKDISASCLKIVRKSLARTLVRGFKENCLSEEHFIVLLQLRMLNKEADTAMIEEMLDSGINLYSSSMKFYELAIKFYLEKKMYGKIGQFFKNAIAKNPNSAIELYHFLCGIYLQDNTEKEKAEITMMEAINNSNKQVSQAFQPYYLQYIALTEGIENARKTYNSLLQTKTMNSLSINFFKAMIKLESSEEIPNDKLITSCYQRATEHFGRENSEVSNKNIFKLLIDFISIQIWLDFIQFLWKQGKFTEADEMKKRALNNMKDDLKIFSSFEKKFTMLRMEIDE